MVANHALAGARAPFRAVVMSVLVLAMLLLAVPAIANARIDGTERATVRYINAYRHAHGLRSVRIDRRMSTGADGHSASMARTRFATHGAWAARVSRYAHSSTIGEVIAWLGGGGGQDRRVVTMWIHSAPHRAVLSNGAYRRVGVARRRSGGTWFYTVDFAR
ncbi:MAG TPA: CAP domain-containing protein [Solirubrobacteraceae bacterium]